MDYRTVNGLRRIVAFTPEEEAENRAYEISPEVRGEFQRAISAERDSAKRAILEASFRQDFGETQEAGWGFDISDLTGGAKSARRAATLAAPDGWGFDISDLTTSQPATLKTKSRSFTDVVGDGLKQAAKSVNTTLGAVSSVFAPESSVSKFFGDNAQYWDDAQSDYTKSVMQAAEAKINEAAKTGFWDEFSTAAKEYMTSPALFQKFVLENAASLIPGLGAAKGAQVAAKGAQLSRGATAAEAAAAGVRAGTVAGGATNSVLNAGGARQDSFDDWKKTLIAQGMDEAQATAIALDRSKLAAVVGGVAGAVSGATGLERGILGGLSKGGVRGAVKGGATELAGEQFEELAPKAATNAQIQSVDPGRTLTHELGRTAAQTLVASSPGAVVSGVAGAIGEQPTTNPTSQATVQDELQPTDQPTMPPAAGGILDAAPRLSAPSAMEGEVLGPEELPGGQRLLESPPIEGELASEPIALPRQALPSPEDGGPTERQIATARGLLAHSPKASPDLLMRLMRVDQTMATMLFGQWQAAKNQQQSEANNGTVTADQANAEMASPIAEGGRDFVPGSADVLASAPAIDFNPAVDSAEMAASGMRPDLAAGAERQTGVATPTDIDVQAHGAATSPFNAHAQPTDAQKESGNYRKGHVTVQGLPIAIENPAGSTRSGKDASGNPWQTEMQNHYGYIKGTVGRDKDHLDVFLGPQAEDAGTAYVIDQIDPKTGRFDEHKIILGAESENEARVIYQSNYQAGWNGLGAIMAMPMADFKAWISSGDTKKPLGLKQPSGTRTSETTSAVGGSASVTNESAAAHGGVDSARIDGFGEKIGGEMVDTPSALASEVPAASGVALPLAMQESAVYAVNEPDAVTGDLFPEELQHAVSTASRNNRDEHPTEDGNLHAASALSVRPDTEAAGLYHVTTQLVTVGKRKLPVRKVSNWQEAAQAFAYLSRYAVEHFDALVTDARGKVLAIIGSFKGTPTQTSVYPGTVMMELARIGGAAHLWASHNHPSGRAELSSADRMISENFRKILRDTSITYHGLSAMALSGNRVDWVNADGGTGSVSRSQPAKYSVPIVEREIVKSSPGALIGNADTAKSLTQQLAGVRPGIVFLTAQGNIAAFVPFDPLAMGKLRSGGRLMQLFGEASKAGAVSAIVAMPDDKVTNAQFANLKGALGAIDVKVLDGIRYQTTETGGQVESLAQTRRDFDSGLSFESRRAGDDFEDLYSAMQPEFGVSPDYQGMSGSLDGKLAFRSQAAVLAHPSPSINIHGFHAGGDRFMKFNIFDGQTGTKVGMVELEMSGDEPVALHDIYVDDALHGSGYGAQVVGTLLSLNPGANLKIVEIISQSERFWESVGAQKGYDGNADLNWHQFAEARPDARGRQEGRESVRPEQAEAGIRGDEKREDQGRGFHSAEEVAGAKSDAAEKSPADAGLSVSGKLPDAIVANPLAETKGDDFAHAKAGSVAASVRLAKKLVTTELVEQLRAIAEGNPLVVGINSIEATGKNALPRAAAEVLAIQLGLDTSPGIVQSTSPKRTSMDGLDRVFSRPEFYGKVEKGRGYILLDDTLTQGGTFAGLAAHIEAGGGHVVAVVALTGKQYSSKLAPTAETLKQIQEKFGDIEGDFRKATGYGFDGLTESEARYLARFDSPVTIRDRILAEALDRAGSRNKGTAEARSAGLTNKTPPPGGVSVSGDGSVSPASAIDRIVESFKAKFKGASDLDIRVVESIYEIPSRYRPSRYAEGVFHDSAGLIYLVADNLLNRDGTPNTRRAFQVLMHESVGHYGLAHMMGKRFSGLLAHVMKVARDSSVKRDIYGPGDKQYATVEAVRLRYPDASDEQVAQEVLARMAESDAASSRFGYARAIVRQWLRDIARVFGINLEVTTDELNDLISKASGYMRAGDNIENDVDPSGMVAASERSPGLESRARVAGDSGRQYSADQQQTFRNIGREVVTQTVKERVAGMWQNIGKKLQQGIADQFAPLKDLGGDAYMLSRMSKGADGALEAMLMYGRVFLNGGIYDVDVKDGGVIDKLLRPLGKEADDFMWWIAGNRADQLASQGREHLMTPADIANLKALASGKLDFDYTLQSGKTTRDRATAYADAKQIMAGFNKSVLDIAEQSGLIDGAERTIWENDFYVPFYREAEEGEKKFPSVKKGLVRQKAFERLKGGADKLNHDLLANTIMNWSHMLNAAAKNRAAKASLEAAESAGVATKVQAGEKGAVYYRDAGKEIHYTVEDPFVLDAVTALEFSGFSGPAMQAMGAFKRWLTMGVTANPAFKIRNLIRDSVSALGQSELSYNLAKNISEGYKATERNSQTYASMLAGGGVIRFGTMIEGNRADHVRQLVEKDVDPSTILDDESKLKAIWNRRVMPLVEAYNELGDRSENINRAALYEQLKKKGMSHAEANLAARDLLDFSMGGTFNAVRFLTQTVPFANARIQGLYKLGRAAKENPKRMGYVVGAVALASLALLAAYHDDDEWKKREDWDRDTYWWFRIGGVAYRIPKPFEIGAIGTLAERSAELLFDKEMDGKRFGTRLAKMVGDTFAMNPVPQMFKPLLDLYSNKDSFSGRPIETTGMEKMRTEDRFTARSSEVAKTIGKAGVLSPVQVDHIIRGYFGWLGTASVKATDEILRAGSNNPRPSMKLRDVFLVGNFVETLPTNSSRYVTQMYDQAKEIEEAYNSWRSYLKQGNAEKANEVFESEKDKINRYRMLQNVKAAESRINAQVRRIESDKGMSGEAKRAELDRLSKQKDEIARSVIGTAGLKK